MLIKRGFCLFLTALLLLPPLSALAESEEEAAAGNADEGADGVSYAFEPPAEEIHPVAGKLEVATAANAALLLRGGGESEAYRYWETSYGHVPKLYRMKKAAAAMLRSAVGRTDDAVPVGYDGIRFQPCYEVPMPVNDEKLQKDLDYNLHGSVYSDSPLTNVTASFASSGGKGVTGTVTFDPAANVTAYSLVSKDEPKEGAALDSLVDVSGLGAGKYTFTLTATSVKQSAPVTLHTATVQVADVETKDGYLLTQNKFDDNYSEALRFFAGDTSQFLFHYWFRGSGDEGRDISTETQWRESHMVETKLGRAHVKAQPYFDKAYDYLTNTYIAVDVLRSTGEVRPGKVIQLFKLIEGDTTPYVPRFQSNLEYVSHHTLGTAVDINYGMYPNMNIITNHELIRDDVQNNLEYTGVKVDDDGQKYYSFYYTGSYRKAYQRVPKTIINYLLYELAFYRAGFQWGHYYETACDSMHFMLSENDPNKFMDSEIGMRKVFTYIEDLPAGPAEAVPDTGEPD